MTTLPSSERTKAPAPQLAHFKQGLFAKMRDRFRL